MSEALAGAVALHVVSAGGLGPLAFATAQAEAGDQLALVVRAGTRGSVRCFEVDALRRRIAHYSATGLAGAAPLQLELYVDAADSAELSVYRGPERVALRRFDHLPAACADRRDAVALSIALALDGVIQELAPAQQASGSSPAPEDAARSNTEATSAHAADAASPKAVLAQPVLVPRANPDSDPGANPASASREPAPVDRSELAPVKPLGAAKPAPSEPRPEPASKSPAQRDSGGETTTRRSRGKHPPIQLHAGGRWLAEALPSPVFAGALGVEIGFSRWFAIDGSAMASTVGDSALAGARAQTRLAGGELLGCSKERFGNFAAQGCLGVTAAACDASGANYPVRFPAKTVLWAASLARLALRWPDERRVSLRLFAQGHVNMVRPELLVDGSSEQLAPAWLGVSAGLDMLISLE